MADDKPSNWKSWNDRYAADPAFKKQVDSRDKVKRSAAHTTKLADTLKMIQGARGSKAKYY